jgi:hypothetical protein
VLERLLAAVGGDRLHRKALHDRLQGEQVVFPVVDEKDPRDAHASPRFAVRKIRPALS